MMQLKRSLELTRTRIPVPPPAIEGTVIFEKHQRMPVPLELVIVGGRGRGKRYPLIAGRQGYGRLPENDIAINDPTVSARHGIIECSGKNHVTCYDMSSTNGISRHGKRAPLICLKIGQILQVGAVYLKLVRAGKKQSTKRLKGPLFFCLLLIAAIIAGSHGPPILPRKTEPSRPALVRRPSRPLSQKNDLRKNVMLQELAERAQTAFAGGQHRKAYSLWKQVLKTKLNHPGAQQGLNKLERVASRLYEEALMTQILSPTQSRQLLQKIMAITSPSTTVYRRAIRFQENLIGS